MIKFCVILESFWYIYQNEKTKSWVHWEMLSATMDELICTDYSELPLDICNAYIVIFQALLKLFQLSKNLHSAENYLQANFGHHSLQELEEGNNEYGFKHETKQLNLNEKDQNDNLERVQIHQRIQTFTVFPSCSTLPSNADKYLCCGLLSTLSSSDTTVSRLSIRPSVISCLLCNCGRCFFFLISGTYVFFCFVLFFNNQHLKTRAFPGRRCCSSRMVMRPQLINLNRSLKFAC